MVSPEKTQDFIDKANKKHGFRYDYTRTDYVRSSAPVVIGCGVHGFFEQMPRNHLRGSGCPLCSTPEVGKEGSTLKKVQAEQSKFFPPGTLLKLPFWEPVPQEDVAA